MKSSNIYSTFLDLSRSIKVYYILAVGSFFSVLIYILLRDVLATLVMVASTVSGFYILSRPPQKIDFEIKDDGIQIGENFISLKNCVEWAVIDLGDVWEFVIRTDQYLHQFYYFYAMEKDNESTEIAKILHEILVYNDRMPRINIIHTTLRKFGLK